MVVEVIESSMFSFEFYLIIFLAIALIGLTIFFIKKLNQNLKQILRSLWVSVLISLVIYVLLILVTLFSIVCDIGGKCPSFSSLFIGDWLFALGIFLVVIFVYYLIKFPKK